MPTDMAMDESEVNMDTGAYQEVHENAPEPVRYIVHLNL